MPEPKLELHMAVSHHVSPGNQTQVLRENKPSKPPGHLPSLGVIIVYSIRSRIDKQFARL